MAERRVQRKLAAMKGLQPQFLAAAAVAAPLIGCVTNIDIELPPTGKRATLTEKLPLTVGVIYDQRFRSYSFRRCITYGMKSCDSEANISVGKASVALFDRTMRALFARVERVDPRIHSARTSWPFDAIIEPEILDYSYSYRPSRRANISYRLVLRTPEGEKVAQWTTSGEAELEGAGLGLQTYDIEQTTLAALRAAEAKILARLLEQSDVRRWLANRGISPVGA